MGMDGLNLAASVCEIKALLGGRIDKVQQPEKDELLLGIYNNNQNYKLLINVSAANCRLQLTQAKRSNPAEPPMFCMLLRKRILGGRLISAEQPNLDRVVLLGIQAQNELGDLVELVLAVEIMGKHSNAILVNENGVILDSARRVGPGISNVRMVLPGMRYAMPPSQDKRSPLLASQQDICSALNSELPLGKALSAAFFGLSPAMAARLCGSGLSGAELTGEQLEKLSSRIYAFYTELAQGRFTPSMETTPAGEPLAVFPFVLAEGSVKPLDSLWQGFDELYANLDVVGHIQRHGASVRRILQNNIERCEKKLSLYAEALGSSEKLEEYRLFGELITANLYALKQGASCAALSNYYLDPPQPVQVPLDPRCTPNQNAQKYYKKYQKGKSAMEMAAAQREETCKELDYLEGQLDNLDKCTTDLELSELADELYQQGYIRRSRAEAKKQQPHKASQPMCFIASDGTEIFVGKNNRQNDYLTLKLAGPEDTWLHTKDIPGSHVIIKNAEPSKETLFEAALLAAYYSKARGGQNVPVDFAKKKFVKKPAGARPGMVIYTTNRTAYVTPDEEAIKHIQQKQ